jgi:hypothetical protein
LRRGAVDAQHAETLDDDVRDELTAIADDMDVAARIARKGPAWGADAKSLHEWADRLRAIAERMAA